jgi:hypothetical protein
VTLELRWGDEQVRAIFHSEEPDLTSRFDQLFPSVWPEYNRHGDVLHPAWEKLYECFPEYQFVLVQERTGRMLARGNTIPFVWDGTVDGLPGGIDDLIMLALAAHEKGIEPNTISAMAAEVPRRNRSKGFGVLVLKTMAALASAQGFANLLAPARPSWKERYPLAPISEYVTWKAADGLPFDPWLRAHVMLGAEILKPAPESLRITGTVAEWESWTGLAYPATGTYVFPWGLSTLDIDRDADQGRYWEPNVWILHKVPPGG